MELCAFAAAFERTLAHGSKPCRYFLVNGWVTMCLDGHFPETMPVTKGRKTYRASVTLDSLQKSAAEERAAEDATKCQPCTRWDSVERFAERLRHVCLGFPSPQGARAGGEEEEARPGGRLQRSPGVSPTVRLLTFANDYRYTFTSFICGSVVYHLLYVKHAIIISARKLHKM